MAWNAAAVADAIIAFQKGITLQQIRALRDNMLAIAAGLAGAPKNVAASLNSGTNSVTASLAAGANISIAIGAYAFLPSVSMPNGTAMLGIGGTTADDPSVRLENTTGASFSYTVRWRSIT